MNYKYEFTWNDKITVMPTSVGLEAMKIILRDNFDMSQE